MKHPKSLALQLEGSSFRVDGNMVFQIQLAKRQEVVPLTRDYITERETDLRRREAARPSVRHAAE